MSLHTQRNAQIHPSGFPISNPSSRCPKLFLWSAQLYITESQDLLSYSSYFLPFTRTNCRLPRNTPFDYPEPDESSPYPHIVFKPNFNIILASKLSFPKKSHVPSTNHVRGNKSTHAHSYQPEYSDNMSVHSQRHLATCHHSCQNKVLCLHTCHLPVTYQQSNHAFSCIQVIFNCSNRHLDENIKWNAICTVLSCDGIT
jgi:hypothetical protein